jgi:hypothetical protein
MLEAWRYGSTHSYPPQKIEAGGKSHAPIISPLVECTTELTKYVGVWATHSRSGRFGGNKIFLSLPNENLIKIPQPSSVYSNYAYDIDDVLLFPIPYKVSLNVKGKLLQVSTSFLVALLISLRSAHEELLEM